jgi:hypothetical protein
MFSAAPTPGNSAGGVGRGQIRKVSGSLFKWMRKNIFTKLNEFILVFTSYLMSNAPKTMELRFPHASCSSHLPSILLSVAAASFWLVVAFKIIDQRPFEVVVYFIFFLFHCSIWRPKRWDSVPPRASRPARLRSNAPPTTFTNYQVDCCLKSLNSGHQGQSPAHLSIFLCALPRRSNQQSWQRQERTKRPAPASDP